MTKPAAVARLLLLALLPFGAARAQSRRDTIRIHAARVLDGTGRSMGATTITVSGGKIISVRSGGSKAKPDYELGSLTLLPGLIDAHAHIAWYFNKAGRLHTSQD